MPLLVVGLFLQKGPKSNPPTDPAARRSGFSGSFGLDTKKKSKKNAIQTIRALFDKKIKDKIHLVLFNYPFICVLASRIKKRDDRPFNVFYCG